MSKLPSIKQILPENFATLAWMPRLLAPLNQFFEETIRALNRQLTVNENMAGALLTVTLDGTYPLKITWPLPAARPVFVAVGAVSRTDGQAVTLTSAPAVQWSFNQAGQLQIDGVTGITPSPTARYVLTLLCLTG